jgi:hypothetical protein
VSEWPVGTHVDLYDTGFKQWRGQYLVVKQLPSPDGLYKIRNTRTNSQQVVNGKHLRMGRLKPFRISIV